MSPTFDLAIFRTGNALCGVTSALRDAGTAVFVKQLGTAWARAHGSSGKGARWDVWPADLRVREYPRAAGPVGPGGGGR